MTSNELNLVLAAQRESVPPCKLELLERISSIDWKSIDVEDIDVCSEIILRATADAIVCKFDVIGEDRKKYKSVFHKIIFQIQCSDLALKSKEFNNYLSKYRTRVAELDE